MHLPKTCADNFSSIHLVVSGAYMQVSNGHSIRFKVVLFIWASSIFLYLSGGRTGHTQAPNLANASQSQILIASPKGTLRADICNDSVVHITAAAEPLALQDTSPTPWITGDCKASPSALTHKDGFTIVKTSKIELRINESNGIIGFFDAAGNSLLQEQSGRTLEPLPGGLGPSYRIQDSYPAPLPNLVMGLSCTMAFGRDAPGNTSLAQTLHGGLNPISAGSVSGALPRKVLT
jgi:hypothetical protein